MLPHVRPSWAQAFDLLESCINFQNFPFKFLLKLCKYILQYFFYSGKFHLASWIYYLSRTSQNIYMFQFFRSIRRILFIQLNNGNWKNILMSSFLSSFLCNKDYLSLAFSSGDLNFRKYSSIVFELFIVIYIFKFILMID